MMVDQASDSMMALAFIFNRDALSSEQVDGFDQTCIDILLGKQKE